MISTMDHITYNHKWLGLLFPESVLIFLTGLAHWTSFKPGDKPLALPSGWTMWASLWKGAQALLFVIGDLAGDPRLGWVWGRGGPIHRGVRGEEGPTRCLSLSFLRFLQMTRSAGCAKLKSGQASWCAEECPRALVGLELGRESSIRGWRLLWLEDGGLGDSAAPLSVGSKNADALRASLKSVSGKATFMISKNMLWTVAASCFTCKEFKKS